jgi:hypothetical protein
MIEMDEGGVASWIMNGCGHGGVPSARWTPAEVGRNDIKIKLHDPQCSSMDIVDGSWAVWISPRHSQKAQRFQNTPYPERNLE